MTERLAVRIDAIILAAGASTRMGTPKQLLPFAEGTMLTQAIAVARAASCQRTFVVLGANADQIAATLDRDALVVANPDWQQGLASSLRAGIAACRTAPAADAVLVMTCDQPLLGDLGPLFRAFQEDPQRIAAAAYADTVGVPAIFPHQFFSPLSLLTGDTGARAVLRKNPDAVNAVALGGAAFDIDTPDDYAQLAALQKEVQRR